MINLSKYNLSANQNKILAKGLNYAVTPEKIPTEEFIVAAEQATWSLPQEQKDKLCADITGVLKSAKVPKQNITRQERTALKGLQKEKSITILPADKGKATVIMEKREYQEKMKEMLRHHHAPREITTMVKFVDFQKTHVLACTISNTHFPKLILLNLYYKRS